MLLKEETKDIIKTVIANKDYAPFLSSIREKVGALISSENIITKSNEENNESEKGWQR